MSLDFLRNSVAVFALVKIARKLLAMDLAD
jgi:hypothetical protein